MNKDTMHLHNTIHIAEGATIMAIGKRARLEKRFAEIKIQMDKAAQNLKRLEREHAQLRQRRADLAAASAGAPGPYKVNQQFDSGDGRLRKVVAIIPTDEPPYYLLDCRRVPQRGKDRGPRAVASGGQRGT